MILSRVMRPGDMDLLKEESAWVDRIVEVMGGWDPVQHPARRWEYALALKAFEGFLQEPGWQVADFGCGIGLMSPLLLFLGQNVSMYEPWVYGDESEKLHAQMRKVNETRRKPLGYELFRRPLCELLPEDRKFDAAFCISTLEHIGEYQRAFRDMCAAVQGHGGLVFLTTDFGKDENDHYKNANLRAGKMFNTDTYFELAQIGREEGFDLVGGLAEWGWSDDCELVNDHGFASLAMVRVG